MNLFLRYFAILVALLFFFMATYLLISPSFSNLNQEARVIVSVLLYLYGIYRLIMIIIKWRKQNPE